MAADNKLLANFDLVGIPPAPRGVPQIEVSFEIDANGIVHVSAKDKATGKEQQSFDIMHLSLVSIFSYPRMYVASIKPQSGLTEDEIQRMVRDAEAHASVDKARKELVELKNDAESLVHSSDRTINEYKDKVPVEIIDGIRTEVNNLREVCLLGPCLWT